MNTQTNIRFTEKSSVSLSIKKLWVQAFENLTTYEHEPHIIRKRCHEVVKLAELSYTVSDYSTIKRASDYLSLSPDARFRSIGRYYEASYFSQLGNGDTASAAVGYRAAAEGSDPVYRLRALLGLGTVAIYDGRFAEGERLQKEVVRALRFQTDPLASYFTQYNLAALSGLQGDHGRAYEKLRALDSAAMFLSGEFPALRCWQDNGVAVEALSLGRVDEAAARIGQVMLSPFAGCSRSWQATAEDVRREQHRTKYTSVPQMPCSEPEPVRTEPLTLRSLSSYTPRERAVETVCEKAEPCKVLKFPEAETPPLQITGLQMLRLKMIRELMENKALRAETISYMIMLSSIDRERANDANDTQERASAEKKEEERSGAGD